MRAIAKRFVDTEFSLVHRALLPAALQTAYNAVDALYRDEPLFDVVTARLGKGHIVAWAVDRQLERMLISGRLPFDYRWASFERPTGKYLQIRLASSTLSISQLSQPTDIPRHAVFRTNRILNNNPLLPLNAEIEEEGTVAGLPHLILIHGYQTLSFAQLGVLHPRPKEFGWIYRTPNLMNATRIIEAEKLPDEEAVDVEAIVTLKADLAKWIRDNPDSGRVNG